MSDTISKKCNYCSGTGEIYAENFGHIFGGDCPYCKGTGDLMSEKELEDMRMIAYNSYDDFSKYAAAKILQLYDHVDGLKREVERLQKENNREQAGLEEPNHD